MKIDMTTATPWPEINMTLKNMRSLAVVVGGKRYEGDADLSIDGHGNVTLTLPKDRKRK